MNSSNLLQNQHLLWRAGFGPLAEEANQLENASTRDYVNALFKASSKSPQYIDVADSAFKGLMMGMQEAGRQQRPALDNDQKKKLRQQSREDIKSLNLAWLAEMKSSDQQLREKMALFWHGHFASRNLNILYQQQLLHIVRSNALGNFGDLLREVSKSASMINFLNNNQNRKGHPNENFAREVMELFTIGRGHYTEEDIKEGARAFTGWGANIAGDFVFRRFQHDTGTKKFLGKSGQFDGDDIISILLEQKATAYFITRKIYRFFVNEQVDENILQGLAEGFYQSNYDIAQLMRSIFSSDWFYAPANIGTRFKSPVELLTGIQRSLPMEWENPEVQLLLQRLLGQLLFYPPNVAGWPGGSNWIDSSSLMLRMRIPQMIFAASEITLRPKEDDDQTMGMQEKSLKRMGAMGRQFAGARINWDLYSSQFNKISREDLLKNICNRLLQANASINLPVIEKYGNKSSREEFIKSVSIRLMSTPEYQLC